MNGTKVFITHGGIAKLYLLMARTDLSKPPIESLACFLVPGDAKGLKTGRIENKLGHKLCRTAEIILEDVEIPEENILGGEGMGISVIMDFIASTGVGVGALAVGVARRAFDLANEYAHTRIQGGSYIFGHQAIGFKLVDMKIKIHTARLLVWLAAWTNSTKGNDNELAAMAKIYPSEIAFEVAHDAMQIFGGYGYMKDYPIEKLFRDARLFQIYDGTNQVLREMCKLFL